MKAPYQGDYALVRANLLRGPIPDPINGHPQFEYAHMKRLAVAVAVAWSTERGSDSPIAPAAHVDSLAKRYGRR